MLFERGKAYSQDLRGRVLASDDEGVRVGRIAAMLRVSVAYVSKVISRRRQTGVTTALPQRCHVLPKLAALHDAIREQVAARPDATIAELRTWLSDTHQMTASNGLMCSTLSKLGLTYKKSRSTPLNRRGPTSPRRAMTGVRSSQA